MMDDQIVEKEKSSSGIEEEMTKKILTQEEEIRKQVTVYSEQARIKGEEETELVKVLADYKKKYEEFSAAMKKSAKTFKVYEGEIKNMNQRALELGTMKRKLLQGDAPASKKKKGGAAAKDEKTVEKKSQDLDKMQSDWVAEKAALEKEKEDLLASSKALQDKIKAI